MNEIDLMGDSVPEMDTQYNRPIVLFYNGKPYNAEWMKNGMLIPNIYPELQGKTEPIRMFFNGQPYTAYPTQQGMFISDIPAQWGGTPIQMYYNNTPFAIQKTFNNMPDDASYPTLLDHIYEPRLYGKTVGRSEGVNVPLKYRNDRIVEVNNYIRENLPKKIKINFR